MQPLTSEAKKAIQNQTRFKRCEICGNQNVEIHHVFTYAGRQIGDPWALAALCKLHHTGAEGFHTVKKTKELVEYNALLRVSLSEVAKKYPKNNWQQLFDYLKNLYVNNLTRKQIRKQVYQRDGYRCRYCGESLLLAFEAWVNGEDSYLSNSITVDHINPKSRGGQFSVENLVTCCRSCNNEKADNPNWGRNLRKKLNRRIPSPHNS